jgi:hypothetical protein
MGSSTNTDILEDKKMFFPYWKPNLGSLVIEFNFTFKNYSVLRVWVNMLLTICVLMFKLMCLNLSLVTPE